MNNPLGVSPSKGKQGTTRGKEIKNLWPRWESNPQSRTLRLNDKKRKLYGSAQVLEMIKFWYQEKNF